MQTAVDDTPVRKVSIQGPQNEQPEVEEDEEEGPKSILQVIGENPNAISTLILCIFLILLSIYAAGVQGDNASFAMRDKVRALYEDFEDVSSVDEWWSYMRGPFINTSYPRFWYNGDPLDQGADRYIGQEFRILGVIQLRQVRVRMDACVVPSRVQGIVSECIATYSTAGQDVAQYGPDTGDGRRLFQFLTSAELGYNDRIRLESGILYDGGGYVTALPTTEDSALNAASLAITQLQTKLHNALTDSVPQLLDSLWIDRQTSAVFVHLNLYHPTLHRLATVQLAWEQRPGFRGDASLQVSVVPLRYLFAAESGGGLLALEAILLTMVVVFALNELFQWSVQGTFTYWAKFWTLYDWTTFILFFIAFSERYGAFMSASGRTFPPDSTEFVSYRTPVLHVWKWKNVLALAVALSWMKLLRQLSLLKFVHHLFAAIYNAAQDLAAVLACMIIVCFGFALAFALAYGDVAPLQSTLGGSMRGVLGMLRGEWKYEELIAYDDYLGPVLFVAFALISWLLLANMLVAVVVSWLSSILALEDPTSLRDELRQRLNHPLIKAALSKATTVMHTLLPRRREAEAEEDSVQQIIQDAGEQPEGDARDQLKSMVGPKSGKAHGFGAMELRSMAPARAHSDGAGAEVSAAVQEHGETLRKMERKLEHDMDLTLQCVLQLSKEVRALSHRVKSLTDTAEATR